MAWIAGLVTSAYGAYSQKRANDAMSTQQDQSLKDALHALTPEKLNKLQMKLLPFFKAQLNAAGAGSNIGESMKAHLAASGELNTPVGKALLDAANASPTLTAFKMSLDAAMSIKQQKTQRLGAAFPYLKPKSATTGLDIAMAGAAGGVRGWAANKALNPTTPSQAPMNDFSTWINAQYPSESAGGFGISTGPKTGVM